jgi:hypothetical membrane protein
MEVRQVGNGADHVLEHRSVIAVLAAAGITGPIIFAVVALVQSVLRSDHNLLEHPISALAAGPSGWVQDVNFLVFGSLMILYAIGLHLGVRPTRWGAVGLAFLSLSGIGLMWEGLFPMRDATRALQENRLLHIPGFIMFCLGAAIGLIVMSRRMAHDPRWRSLVTYARVDRHSHAGPVPGGRRPRATTRRATPPLVGLVSVDPARSVVPLPGRSRA